MPAGALAPIFPYSKKAPPCAAELFRFNSFFCFCGSDFNRKGLGASWAAHGMLTLFARQSQRCAALGTITEHVRIGILIAVMAAEQAADLIFKRTPFGVFGLPFISFSGESARHAPDADPQ
jgi:hypothetical protein